MTVHVFPTGRALADGRRTGRGAPRVRADQMELWLIGGLVAVTAAQIALFVWFWLG